MTDIEAVAESRDLLRQRLGAERNCFQSKPSRVIAKT